MNSTAKRRAGGRRWRPCSARRSWPACPRFLGEVADEAVSDLERLIEDDDADADED
ncbi:hypothetical protein [Streptomyces sp. H39-C1]|uniref:hypothetical protein n=1 Tax=Streptomyces sp. H39-C1 TaxID=3004355 RepID=UPI0022AF3B52|nr:hypothetical protein [Streptomyces sp. H39-C1]MCZ4097640.1 hypothetical protein [Streptomyces sp. H39-C1]